ncbi:MAG: hypothetical protein AMJ89_02825 [candidate division Zixibacteria bacterium SM23_73]|nr:MAG: hypothetical protein AMJ89_02825 [candidate division Zixibacteria bacterium SM23_73]
MGIAHPTGYPIYTILGRIFVLLPARDVIFRVNLMSVLFACFSNLILFFVILKVMEPSFQKEKKGDVQISYYYKIWAAFLASLIFSFTPTLWSQAVSNEVYSLNILFYNLIIIVLLLWRSNLGKLKSERIFFLLVFLYALSFGNHMSTILLFPALIFFVIATQGWSVFQPKKIILSLLLFLLGLSIYIYLPVRSSQNPLLDWGNPETWSTFKRHVTGWQYQVWMFSESTEKLFANLGNFIKLFFQQFPPYLLPLSLLGIYELFSKDRKFLFFLLILFFANIFYGINYDIPDIDPYFLSSLLVNSILIGAGLYSLFQIIQKLRIKQVISYGIILCFSLVPFIILKKNYFEANRSENYFAYDFASNLMRSVKKDAIILTDVWDHYSPYLYLRYIELKRPDVVYLDKELCRRSWYFDYVNMIHPHLFRTSQEEIKEFIGEVYPFENRLPFDPHVIQEAYINMLNSFLVKNHEEKPIYDDLLGETKIGKIFVKIPEGLVYSLKDSVKYYPFDFPDFQLRGIKNERIYKDDRTLNILKQYPLMIGARINYLTYFNQISEASKLKENYLEYLTEPIR